jgi:hypothetical protein
MTVVLLFAFNYGELDQPKSLGPLDQKVVALA